MLEQHRIASRPRTRCDADAARAAKGSDNLAPYRGSRQELTRSLQASEFRTPEERNCLIWIWMVVIGSWRVDGALEPEGRLLSGVFFSKFHEAESWDRIERVMRQFFWDAQLGRVWKLCWQEAFDDYQLQVGNRGSESGIVEIGGGSTAGKSSCANQVDNSRGPTCHQNDTFFPANGPNDPLQIINLDFPDLDGLLLGTSTGSILIHLIG
jgi:hypothetical protein